MLQFKHVTSLVVVSLAIWLLLSGHYTPLLLSLGLASVALTVFLAVRMEVLDHESYPVDITFKLVRYLVWLGGEIIKANLVVTRSILDPRAEISPCFLRVPAPQHTDIGRTIYANSITLTPGTVATSVDDDSIEVHALTRALAEDLQSGEMARRVPDSGDRRVPDLGEKS